MRSTVLMSKLFVGMVGFAVPTLTLVACGGGLAGLCSDVCSCQTCSDQEEAECEENADKAEEIAANSGCEDQLDAFVECQEAAFKCDDENAVFTEDCEKEVAALNKCDEKILGQSIIASVDICVRAAEICNGGAPPPEPPPPQECTGLTECVSQCIIDFNSCTSDEVGNCAVNC